MRIFKVYQLAVGSAAFGGVFSIQYSVGSAAFSGVDSIQFSVGSRKRKKFAVDSWQSSVAVVSKRMGRRKEEVGRLRPLTDCLPITAY